MSQKKKILFVGAHGEVAEKVIPHLAEFYDIVGLSRAHEDMKKYCADFYTGDLLRESDALFKRIFDEHGFEAIIWNVVKYLPGPLEHASRVGLHTEFDLAVALPIACLKDARAHGFGNGAIFVLVSSQLAFGRKAGWGSYSLVKSAQITLASYLNDELSPNVLTRIVAPGSVPDIPSQILGKAFASALSEGEQGRMLYKVDRDAIC